jgi:amino acid transporter
MLLPLGAAGLPYATPILTLIIALLAIVYLSYRQTIGAHPGGGGSYTVAKENLGDRAGLVAAGALAVDYVLNVAVGISAGVEEPCRARGKTPPRLEMSRSGYREIFRPLLRYVRRLGAAHPDRHVVVVVPELVERRWYHYLMHTHKATWLKLLLILRGGPRVVIVSTPWHLTA